MQKQNWLAILHRKLFNSTFPSAVRARRQQSSTLAAAERLESRMLLTASGPEFLVRAINIDKAPSIATDAAGDFVVAWVGTASIYAQRYNAAEVAQGSLFQVSTNTDSKISVKVAMDSAGDFVVTWVSAYQDGSDYGIYARRYNATGVAQGGEFRVNTFTANKQTYPDIAMDSTGDFVIAWESYGQGGSGVGVYAQRYNSSGVAQGTEFKANSETTGIQFNPSVTMDSAGDFVIVWEGYDAVTDVEDIWGQRFDSTGHASGSEFKISANATSPDVAMDSAGDFVVTWQTQIQGGNSFDAFAKRFNSAGVAQGNQFQVNPYTIGFNLGIPQVTMDAAGAFVITWESNQTGNFNTENYVFEQSYTASSGLIGPYLQVNTISDYYGGANFPSVAMDATGDFVVAWYSASASTTAGIYAQRYVPKSAPEVYNVETTPLSAIGPLTTQITSSLLVVDSDSNTLSGATIRITGGTPDGEDVLGFVNTANIHGSWNPTTETMTLTGVDSVSNYRTALRAVTYHNVSTTPDTTSPRTITFQTADGPILSNKASRQLTVRADSGSPVVSVGSGSPIDYVEQTTPVAIVPNLSIFHPDGLNIASATVTFANWQAGDRLQFANSYALQHTFVEDLVAHTATLTLTGSNTTAHYQTTLQSVQFWSVAGSPVTWLRRIATITVTDILSNSASATQSIIVTPTAHTTPPSVAGLGVPVTYTQNAAPLVVAPNLSIISPQNIYSASVVFTNWQAGDRLEFFNTYALQHTFTEDLVAHTAVLTLNKIDTPAHYTAVLDSIRFWSVAGNLNTSTRIATFTVTDIYTNTGTQSQNVAVALAGAQSLAMTNSTDDSTSDTDDE